MRAFAPLFLLSALAPLLAGCSGGEQAERKEPFKPTPMPASVAAEHERLLRERPPIGGPPGARPTGAPSGPPTGTR